MSDELAVMNRDQLEEALKPTEGLTHLDVELGSSSGILFKNEGEGVVTVVLEGNDYQMTTTGLHEAARGVKLPKSFSDFAPRELLLHNLNYLFTNNATGKLRFFLRDGVVIGAHANRPKYYSNLQMVEAAEEVIGSSNVIGYHQASTTLERSRVAIVANRSFEPIAGSGDMLYGGIQFENSIIGEQKIQITPYIFRQWCSNGAYSSENVGQWSHRNDETHDIREWVKSSTDLALQALDTEFGRIQQLTEKSVEGHPIEALRSLFVKFGIPARTQQEIVQAAEGQHDGAGPRTMYDLWNAITRVATHSTKLSVASSCQLQFVAGQVSREVDLCPQCHQLVSIDHSRASEA